MVLFRVLADVGSVEEEGALKAAGRVGTEGTVVEGAVVVVVAGADGVTGAAVVGTEGEGAAGAATPALSQGLGGEGMVVARGTRGRRGGDEKRVKRLGAGPVTALLASVPASGALPALVSPHPGSGICRLCHRVSPSPTRARAHASISFDLAAALLLYKPAYYILCCLYQPSKPASLENGLQDCNHSSFNICLNSPIA